MYKHILESAGNINWMAILALVTFFTLFIIGIVTVFGKNKDYIDKMSNLPLEEDNASDNQ